MREFSCNFANHFEVHGNVIAELALDSFDKFKMQLIGVLFVHNVCEGRV